MDDESTTLGFPCFQAFVPVQFDTAWSGQRGAQRVPLQRAGRPQLRTDRDEGSE